MQHFARTDYSGLHQAQLALEEQKDGEVYFYNTANDND